MLSGSSGGDDKEIIHLKQNFILNFPHHRFSKHLKSTPKVSFEINLGFNKH